MRGWPDRAEDPSRWWAQTLGTGVLGTWITLFILTAVAESEDGSWGHALSIALGTADPFTAKGADVPGVALAVFSWLLVPAIVGTIAALLTANALRQSRPLSKHDLEEGIRRLREGLQ
jgi:hypothetical protein